MKKRESFAENRMNEKRHSGVEKIIKGSDTKEEKKQMTQNYPEIQIQKKEVKNKKVVLLLKSSTHTGLQKIAKTKGISVNEASNQILDIYMKTNGIIL